MSEAIHVGVFFGGRSVEHEVSVVTAQQVIAALPADRFRAVPIYVAKNGSWYTGDALRDIAAFRDVERVLGASTEVRMAPVPAAAGALQAQGRRQRLFGDGGRELGRIDVAMPLIHGSHGEDGTLQGFLELADIAYTGCDVTASAVSMDKPLSKAVLRDAGLPVVDHAVVARQSWEQARERVRADIVGRLRFPLFVKPATLGSSIGVSRAEDGDSLASSLDLAFAYDRRCVVEPAVLDSLDVNCSVLGYGDDVQASVCEQPVSSGVLTYADKYLSKSGVKSGGAAATGMKGARRLIPAPLPAAVTERVQAAARTAFHAIGATGVVRVDFLVSAATGEFVVNEVNTIPGSLAFYLWDHSGVPFPALVSRLVEIAQQRHAEKQRTTYSIDTWLLRGKPA